MRISNWIRGILDFGRPGPSSGQGGGSDPRTKVHLFDVTDGFFLVEEARRFGLSLIRKSRNDLSELKRRLTIRRKVRSHVADPLDLPEIVDEVTQKIYTTSQDDNRLKKLFG